MSIRVRVREWISNARAKGVRFSQPDRMLPKDFEKYYKKWKGKEITVVEFAKIMNVSRATIYRFIKEYEV